MTWIVLAVALFANAPAYTMTPEPGDTVRAQLFERAPGAPRSQLIELLGGSELAETPITADENVLYVARTDVGAVREVIVYQRRAEASGSRWFCKLSASGNMENENSARALRWCLSFVDKAPEVRVNQR